VAERDAYTKAGVDYGVIDPGKLLAQRTAHGVSPCLRDRSEDELERFGYDHLPVKFGVRFSRNAATPSR